jgi:hypothetical protein
MCLCSGNALRLLFERYPVCISAGLQTVVTEKPQSGQLVSGPKFEPGTSGIQSRRANHSSATFGYIHMELKIIIIIIIIFLIYLSVIFVTPFTTLSVFLFADDLKMHRSISDIDDCKLLRHDIDSMCKIGVLIMTRNSI